MRSRFHLAAWLLGLAMAIPGQAQAALIIQNTSFSFSGIPGSDVIGFQEFNPALGTLNGVDVSFVGSFNFGVLLGPNQSVVPEIDLDAVRFGARGFAFAQDGARFLFAPTTNFDPTAPAFASFATAFSLDFSLDAFTDLSGLVVPQLNASNASIVPPLLEGVQRADFVQGIAPIGINELLLFAPSGFTPTGPIAGGGLVTLVYDYTPAPVAAVPLPPTVALLAIGLAALGGVRRGDARSRECRKFLRSRSTV